MKKKKLLQAVIASSLVLDIFGELAVVAQATESLLEDNLSASITESIIGGMNLAEEFIAGDIDLKVEESVTEELFEDKEDQEIQKADDDDIEYETEYIVYKYDDIDPDLALEDISEIEDHGIESYASTGAGLVQLWQVIPDGQQSKEGKTTSEIMNALKCKPNHNLYPLNSTEHQTYVNSCYVDDALYLGEDTNYYYIYLSGYEGKVPKEESHKFELDLNNDGKYVEYEIQTVAYYVPASGARSAESGLSAMTDVPELKYNDDYLDKDFIQEEGIVAYANNTVQSPSYYAKEGEDLIHYITNNVTVANNYSSIIVGKAPGWMESGVKYYSYDGIYFYTSWQNIKVDGSGAVNSQDPFYNYYQYLPYRSTSLYNASDYNNFTASYGYTKVPSGSSAASNESQLVNAGNIFVSAQEKFSINGALEYAMAIHESGWGRSTISVQKNNLFGMNATDNNPYGNATSFPSVENGVYYHSDCYISQGYTDPSDWRYYGSHVGNKGSGMNVKYASDPFWGEKIAAWYYKFDLAGGLKDYNNHTIGIKATGDVYNIRQLANINSSILYQTKNSNAKIYNYPFLILGEENNFYRIQTDVPIVNGAPVYSAIYNKTSSQGYVSKECITYMNKDNINSTKLVGWNFINNNWYYYNTNGEMHKGWLYIDGKEYYLNPDGTMHTGWLKLDGNWYCFYESGSMIKGWVERPDGWYYTNSKGIMQTGWLHLSDKTYYLNSNGKMHTGWLKLDGNWYCFYDSGSLIKGWIERPDGWYYSNNDGIMQTGWKTINGKRYYFNSSGKMVVNTVVDGYEIGPDGAVK